MLRRQTPRDGGRGGTRDAAIPPRDRSRGAFRRNHLTDSQYACFLTMLLRWPIDEDRIIF